MLSIRAVNKVIVDKQEDEADACLSANELARICLSPQWEKLVQKMSEDKAKATTEHFTACRGASFLGCLCLRSGRAGEPLLLTCENVETATAVHCSKTKECYMYRYR